MKKSTMELLDVLKNSPFIEQYLENESESLAKEELDEVLSKLIAKKNMKRSEIIKRSGLDKSYAYQIFSGEKIPSRQKLIALMFGMKLSTDEVQDVLKRTGYPPLYPRIEVDAVILFCLQKGLSITDANEFLYDLGYEILS